MLFGPGGEGRGHGTSALGEEFAQTDTSKERNTMPFSEGKWAGAGAFERIPDDEERLIDEMHTLLQEKMSKDYPAGQTKRDAHPKNLACLQAECIVEAHIPAELKAGIFASPITSPAWIRISRSIGKIQSGKAKDLRGFAIKLMGVKGERFEKRNEEPETQDFSLISYPTMPLGTVKLFHEAVSDFHRRNMFDAIQAGNFPEREFAVQLFTQKEVDQFPFDHLDATKLIPKELAPLRVIGCMALDCWPNNCFAETEQVAYWPSHVIPGIDFSNAPLLHGQLFSYRDTQLARLGSPNFYQIPINAPKCPFANHQRDGQMQMAQPTDRVAHGPNPPSQHSPRETPTKGFRSATVTETGEKGRIRAASFSDQYSQARRQFYFSQTTYEQAHIASMESAAIDCGCDAFGHLKASAVDEGG